MVRQQQSGAQGQPPLILSLGSVAVSKQKALLHATAATQVHGNSSSAAASRARHHAVLALAQGQLENTHMQAEGAVSSGPTQVLPCLFAQLFCPC